MHNKWLIAGLAGLLGALIANQLHCRRRDHQHKQLKHDVQRWEGEGGNVPGVPPAAGGG